MRCSTIRRKSCERPRSRGSGSDATAAPARCLWLNLRQFSDSPKTAQRVCVLLAERCAIRRAVLWLSTPGAQPSVVPGGHDRW
jgi:hypothetical protein